MDTGKMKKQIQKAFDKEDGVRRLILTCSCHNQDKKAKESFALLFPGEPAPDVPAVEIIRGRDRIYKLSQELGGHEHIKTISKLSGKYAYYIILKGNEIVEEYDLVAGRRIA